MGLRIEGTPASSPDATEGKGGAGQLVERVGNGSWQEGREDREGVGWRVAQ